ncbi:MAG: hypothetical protein UZ15_CFX003000433 [Chloroflexi bacterium OLB15]|nr:MAG: hypothetical protein UZ15_CFX003000433 [Chloroflexi bacterium OLB15]
MSRRFEITDARGGAALTVRVVTQAERTEIAGVQDDGVLKIRLIASPAGAPAANQELVDFLADQLGVPSENVAVVAGENGREKIVSIEGLSVNQVEAILHGGQ